MAAQQPALADPPASRRRARGAPGLGADLPAADLPVARVVVDTPLAHLDRPFDYLVPASMAGAAVPGSRVKVRFAGRVVDGFVLERLASSDHQGTLAPLARAVSSYPVLSPPVAALARAVADRYAGTMADVLRLAVPARHARTERTAARPPEAVPPPVSGPAAGPERADGAGSAPGSAEPPGSDGSDGSDGPASSAGSAGSRGAPGSTGPAGSDGSTGSDGSAGSRGVPRSTGPAGSAGSLVPVGTGAAPGGPVDAGEWRVYPEGPAFLGALAAGRAPRAVWWALPGPSWPAMSAAAVSATVASGRGALVVVPDHRDVDRVADALTEAVGTDSFVSLRADAGPGERYRRYLEIRSGSVRVVVGTRAAVFAPVVDLGLIVVWDDGDDLHAEPRAPYPHARDVAVLRSRLEGCAALFGGHSPSAEAAALVQVGWARPLVAGRAAVRAAAPLVEAAGSDLEVARDPAARAARLPSVAWRTARAALEAGRPVLVQVPRRGYHPSLACEDCRRPARCRSCHGPLGRGTGAGPPACRWCGRPATPAEPSAVGRRSPAGPPGAPWSCPSCGGVRLRAAVTGDRRTAEELGRAFPGVPVRTSGRDEVLARIPGSAALVVATPGAEPVADGGYGAVLLLDGWSMLGRPDLRAGEETLRRWCAAAALARSGPDGGRVVVMADLGLGPVQALVRWDPAGFVAREAQERAELGFPPAMRVASVEGSARAVADLLDAADLPDGANILGPVPVPVAESGPGAPGRGESRPEPAGKAGGQLFGDDRPERPGELAEPGGPGESRVGTRRIAKRSDGSDDFTGVRGRGGEPPGRERVLVRVPRERGAALAAALKAARGSLDARKAGPVRVQLDPESIG